MHKMIACSAAVALLSLAACKTASSAMDGVQSAGSAVASGASSVAGAVPSLVNVNLSNVLNDLALDLKIDKSNIPINAQIPISLAANICGVSINILSFGAGGGKSSGCTAQTASPELVQAVQQQLAANGSVGGGAQTGTTPAPTSPPTLPTTTPTSPTPDTTPETTPQN